MNYYLLLKFFVFILITLKLLIDLVLGGSPDPGPSIMALESPGSPPRRRWYTGNRNISSACGYHSIFLNLFLLLHLFPLENINRIERQKMISLKSYFMTQVTSVKMSYLALISGRNMT